MYYGNQKKLEYDFIVQPGVDPNLIQIGFKGAEKIEIDEQGDLNLHLKGGDVFFHAPVIYQEIDGQRNSVSGHYVLADEQTVAFTVGEYDTTQPLIIDPVLSYATYHQAVWTKSSNVQSSLIPAQAPLETRFDPQWQSEGESPFIPNENGFSLPVKIGAAKNIFFPSVLDSQTPIVIQTQTGAVRQFLAEVGTYKVELVGRYLIYRGEERSILYRYDVDKNELREFVYLADESSLAANGKVMQWRFEGAELSPRKDGSVALVRKSDPVGEVKKVAGQDMAARIQNFLANRRGQSLSDETLEKALFIIPAPEYVDGELATHKENVRYEIEENELTLTLNMESDFLFPLWVDPTLTADADADVIIYPQTAGDTFGISVASAGDFNGDGVDDVIVGARGDDNNGLGNSGSAFIFFGGVTGTKNADADADVILNGQGAQDAFGVSVASAGDFNGDGKDDVIIGQGGTANTNAFIIFGGRTGTIVSTVANTDLFIGSPNQTTIDNFGRSVAGAGDFNGDGLDDVIVGADENSTQGKAYIFYGGKTGSTNAVNADVIINGQDSVDAFGWSVAGAGDFNNDGFGDVIVGAIGDANIGANAGSAFIFFGGLPFSTFVGGTDADEATGVAVDSDGSAYITGFTTSTNFPTASYDDTFNGSVDVFVTKLNPGGDQIVYSTFMGGVNNDQAKDIAVDGDHNAYIAGFTTSPDFPFRGGLQDTFGGSVDAFAVKLNEHGWPMYSTYFGNIHHDEITGIAVDTTRNIPPNLFVASNTNNNVREFEGTAGISEGIFIPASANLDDPHGMVFHPVTGNLLVTDFSNEPGNGVVREFDGTTGAYLGDFVDTTNLNSPMDLAFHPITGNLLVVDFGNSDVREFDGANGSFIGIFGDTAANLDGAKGMAFHPVTGNLFVSDDVNNDVREFDGTTRAFLGIFAEPGNLSDPLGIAFHPVTHNLLVADFSNQDVREFNDSGGGFLGSFGDTGAVLTGPLYLTFHPVTGNLLVTDNSDGTVEEFYSDGNYVGTFGSAADMSGATGLAFEPSPGPAVYVAGITSSPDLFEDVFDFLGAVQFTETRPAQTDFGGSTDAVVVKVDGAGDIEYATFLGGQHADEATSIAVDSGTPSGNLFVGGWINAVVGEYDRTTGTFRGVFGETTSQIFGQTYDDLAFHPTTGNLFVSVRDGGVNEYDATTGAFIRNIDPTGFALNNRGIAFHPLTGNLFVVDAFNTDVWEFDGKTGALIGSFGDTAAQLSNPKGLAFHPITGNLVVSDISNVDVKEFNGITGQFIGVFGDAVSPNLFQPNWLAFHPISGNLLVSDGPRVREFDGATGTFLGTFGDTADFSLTMGKLTFHPVTGNLFVPDSGGVREFDGKTGTFIDIFGDAGSSANAVSLAFRPAKPPSAYVAGFTQSHTMFPRVNPFQDGFGGNGDAFVTKLSGDGRAFEYSTFLGGSSFDSANAITVDKGAPTGNLFVLDLTQHDVREFDKSTGDFYGIFGQTTGNLLYPQGVVFHPLTGNLLVADSLDESGNGVVREFNGITGTYIGNFVDTDAGLTSPQGLAFHPVTGNLLVADFSNGDVEEFDGTSGALIGSFGETAANLLLPSGLAFHPGTGNLFVGDLGNGEVEEFDSITGVRIGTAPFGDTSILFSPRDLAFHPITQNLLVAERTAGIQEFDGSTGTSLGFFGQAQPSILPFPAGLVFPPNTGHLLVSDFTDDNLEEFDSDGIYIGEFGEANSSPPGNLAQPFSMAFMPVLKPSAYVAGSTSSNNFPVQNAYQPNYGGGATDAFLAKLGGNGDQLVYSTYLGSTTIDEGRGVAVNEEGNAYVVGFTNAVDFPFLGGIQSTFAGSMDAFLTKFTPEGDQLVFSTYLGGEHRDEASDVAVDNGGHPYITGITTSTDFLPDTSETTELFAAFGGSVDAFLSKLNWNEATQSLEQGFTTFFAEDLRFKVGEEKVEPEPETYAVDIDVQRAEVRRHSRRGRLDIDRGYLTLDAASDGVDPINEEVTVTFGEFTETLLAGSFVRSWRGYRYDNGNGIRPMRIYDSGRFVLQLRRIDTSGIDLREPVPFTLQIGNDTGEVALKFNRRGRL